MPFQSCSVCLNSRPRPRPWPLSPRARAPLRPPDTVLHFALPARRGAPASSIRFARLSCLDSTLSYCLPSTQHAAPSTLYPVSAGGFTPCTAPSPSLYRYALFLPFLRFYVRCGCVRGLVLAAPFARAAITLDPTRHRRSAPATAFMGLHACMHVSRTTIPAP